LKFVRASFAGGYEADLNLRTESCVKVFECYFVFMNKLNKKPLKQRTVDQASYVGLLETGIHPVMARLYASRSIKAETLLPDIGDLPAKDTLEGCIDAGKMLADAVMSKKHITILGDFDSDGATSVAIFVRALRSLEAKVDYLIPCRTKDGYGISVALARRAKERGSEVIVTVDNGVSGFAGILEAKKLGMTTIIIDHHLASPDGKLPEADCIVNPNIIGSKFKTRCLAGVGVAFYVLGALREELKARNFPRTFNMSQLIELVSIGTVGDMMFLCETNRALVNLGIDRMREGKSLAGTKALLSITAKNPLKTNAETIGFTLAPRINAAGRLETADIAIEMLITDDIGKALSIAKTLDNINAERKAIQSEMNELAIESIENLDVSGKYSLVVFDENNNEGVIGLTASALKEKYSLPSGAFAIAHDGRLKGSFRSIDGVHVRDAIDLVSKRCPELDLRGGGHAMASGYSLARTGFDKFQKEFDRAVRDIAIEGAFNPCLMTDGELKHGEITFDLITAIKAENWGQGFPVPLFEGTFRVVSQRILKNAHTKLRLQKGLEEFEAILFNHNEPLPETISALYKIDVNEYQGVSTVQLMIEAINE